MEEESGDRAKGTALCSPVLKSTTRLLLHLFPYFPMVAGSWGKERGLGVTLQPLPLCRGVWGSWGYHPRDKGSLR